MGLRRCLFACACAVLLGGPGMASTALPPIVGEFGGNFALNTIKGLPLLAWHVQTQPDGQGGLLVIATITAKGLNLEIEATMPGNDQAGTWKVRKGELDAAAWAHVLSAQVVSGKVPTDLEVTGAMNLSGGGSWKGAEITGEITARLENGAAASASQGWSIKGVALETIVSIDAPKYVLRTTTLRADTLNTASLAARNFQMEAVGEGDKLTVKRAEMQVLAGKISLAPFVFDLTDPSVKTEAELTAVALEELVHFLPPALSEAKGLVGGKVNIDWSLRLGLKSAGGALVVSREAPASLRLAATPGFLTGRVPRRFQLLPEQAGFLSRWITLNNPSYPMLKHIELGEAGLIVESLQVQLYPDGPQALRSVHIDVLARPEDTRLVKSVHFEVNVLGTLDQVLKLGTTEGLKINASATLGK